MADVFISYSRRDTAFVQVLYDALQASDYATWIDWQDIAPTSEWWKEIEAGIEAAHSFIFVISKDSIASDYCRREIEHALTHGKRLIPVLRRKDYDRTDVHPRLSQHQWVAFQDNDDFETAFATLVETINTDLEHKKSHTRLQVRAIEWRQSGDDPSLLLRGSNLNKAEQWLLQSAGKDPSPTPLQGEYIAISRQSSVGRQRMLTAALGSLLVLAIGGSGVALWQSGAARQALATAEAALASEEEQRQLAEQRQKDAEAAQRDAEVALKQAEKAKQETEAALTEAETAKQAALTAEQQAEERRSAAEIAQNQAIQAQRAETIQRQLAEQQQEEAKKNLDNMVAVIDGVSERIQGGQNLSFRVVGFAPLQRDLFSFFLDYHKYITENSSDTSNFRRSAEARFRIGQASEIVGDSITAQEEYRLAFNEATIAAEREAQAGSVSEDVLRLINDVAVVHAWNRMNHGDLEEAEFILTTAKTFANNLKSDPSPALENSLGSLENSFARLLEEKGNPRKALEHQRKSVAHAEKAAKLDSENIRFQRNHAVFLRNLSRTPESLMPKDQKDAYKQAGCDIAKQADERQDSGIALLGPIVSCAIDESFQECKADTFGQYQVTDIDQPDSAPANCVIDEAFQKETDEIVEHLLSFKSKLDIFTRLDSTNVEFKLARAQIHARLFHIEKFKRKNLEASRHYLELTRQDWLGVIGDGKTFPLDLYLFRSIYVDTLDGHLRDPDYGSPEVRNAAFQSIAEAIAKTDRNFGSSSQIALIAAISSTRLGELQRESSPRASLHSYGQAVERFTRAQVLENTSIFTEHYEWACSAYEARLSIHADSGDVDAALIEMDSIKRLCMPIFEKYRFDFYLHAKIRSAHAKLGKLLFDNSRYSEALPILNYASKWGIKESSMILGEMYHVGLGVSVDRVKAAELRNLAGRQSMKRFTVPSDFGAIGKQPFHFYVYEKPLDYEYRGIDDQVEWLRQARGGSVPADVVDSFKKLHQIAIDNNVSFPDLAAYAIGLRNTENSDSETTEEPPEQ